MAADISILPSSSHATCLHLHRRKHQQYHRLNLRRQFPRRSFLSAPISSAVYICRSNYSSQKLNFKNNYYNEAEFDDGDESAVQWGELVEEYIDSLWIFKVFGSYGWMLPPILISLLLADGLKAFLITLAFPLSFSTVTFALQKIQNKIKNQQQPKRTKRMKKNRRKGRSRAYSSSRTVKFGDVEEEWDAILGVRKEKKGYQSWVPKKDDASVSSSDKKATDFGGW